MEQKKEIKYKKQRLRGALRHMSVDNLLQRLEK